MFLIGEGSYHDIAKQRETEKDVSQITNVTSQKSEPNCISLRISIEPWLFLTSLFYILSQLNFSHLGPLQVLKKIFYRLSAVSSYSSIAVRVLIVNIIFFSKVLRW